MSSADTTYQFPRIAGTNFYGNVDRLEIRKDVAVLLGWIFSSDSNDPVLVTVISDGKIIGRKLANESRPDVLAAGAPTDSVGFQIPLRSTGNETQISIQVSHLGMNCLLSTLKLSGKLPQQRLTRDDVASVFRLLFLREPEDDGAVIHQLERHTEKSSLFVALFDSPEFYEKHPSLIKILHDKKFG